MPREFASERPSSLFELGLAVAEIAMEMDQDRTSGIQGFEIQGVEQKHVISRFLLAAEILSSWPTSIEALLRIGDRSDNARKVDIAAKSLKKLSRFHPILRGTLSHVLRLDDVSESAEHGLDEGGSIPLLRIMRQSLNVNQLMTCKEAAAYLKIGISKFAAARNFNLIPGTVEAEYATLVKVDEIKRLRSKIEGRTTYSAVAGAMGLTSRAVEQLVAAKLLRGMDHPLLAVLAEGPRADKASAEALLSDLDLKLRLPDEALEPLISMHEAMKVVSGINKPWAPFITAVLDGRIQAFRCYESRGLRSLQIQTTWLAWLRNAGIRYSDCTAEHCLDSLTESDALEALSVSRKTLYSLASSGHISLTGTKIRPVALRGLAEFTSEYIPTAEIRVRAGLQTVGEVLRFMKHYDVGGALGERRWQPHHFKRADVEKLLQ